MSLVMEEKRPRTRVRERAEEQSATMDSTQQAAIRSLANDLHLSLIHI